MTVLVFFVKMAEPVEMELVNIPVNVFPDSLDRIVKHVQFFKKRYNRTMHLASMVDGILPYFLINLADLLLGVVKILSLPGLGHKHRKP